MRPETGKMLAGSIPPASARSLRASSKLLLSGLGCAIQRSVLAGVSFLHNTSASLLRREGTATSLMMLKKLCLMCWIKPLNSRFWGLRALWLVLKASHLARTTGFGTPGLGSCKLDVVVKTLSPSFWIALEAKQECK